MVHTVSKHFTPPSKKVELRKSSPPSRIRREPPPAEKPASLEKALWRQSRELEIGLAIVGMILFALGIDAVIYLFAGFISR